MCTLMLGTLDLNILSGKTIYMYLLQYNECISYNNYFIISVCYLAGEFARTLQKKQPELKITDKDVLCVEIAGLIHDLGNTMNNYIL